MRELKSWPCLGLLVLLGCGSQSMELDDKTQGLGCDFHADCADDAECDSATRACRPLRPTRDVDILFLIDSSPSMALKQEALSRAIPAFIERIHGSGADYHVGIATSDVGSTTAPHRSWGGNIGSCDTFAGDDGVLQDLACSHRNNGSAEARAACARLCPDARYVPFDGRRFIARVGGVTNVPPDLQRDPRTGMWVDRGPIRAFNCMASVGDGGCGTEGQLEGMKRALDGHSPDNGGFLRPGSVLAVVIITDEDDCSVQLSRRSESNPLTVDCAAPDPNASHDCYNVDYRCMARSIECDEAMNVPGAKHNCRERASSFLTPVDEYVRFLNRLRPRSRFLLGGIWTLPSLEAGGALSVSFSAAGKQSAFLNRDRPMCVSSKELAGMPQLRLSRFAAHYKNSVLVDLCATDKYPDALDEIAAAILDRLTLEPPG